MNAMIDRAARAYLVDNVSLAGRVITELVDATIADGWMHEDLHRNDLQQMAADCVLRHCATLAGDGVEWCFTIGDGYQRDVIKADFERLGIPFKLEQTGDEQ